MWAPVFSKGGFRAPQPVRGGGSCAFGGAGRPHFRPPAAASPKRAAGGGHRAHRQAAGARAGGVPAAAGATTAAPGRGVEPCGPIGPNR